MSGQAYELVSGSSGHSHHALVSFRRRLDEHRDHAGVLDNDQNQRAIATVLADVGLCSHGSIDSMSYDEVRTLAQQAFSQGLVSLRPVRSSFRPLLDINQVPTDLIEDLCSGDEPEVEATHTLTLVLVDVNQEPVAGAKYRVELPGGEVISGNLNAQGKALLTGIVDAGQCVVNFPEYDRDVWRAAAS